MLQSRWLDCTECVWTHRRDLRLSFSMLFSGPSLSYEARCSSVAPTQHKTQIRLNLCSYLMASSRATHDICGIKMQRKLQTDRLRWRQAWWRGTGGRGGLCRMDKSPDATPGTRSPALQAPTVSVGTQWQQTLWHQFYRTHLIGSWRYRKYTKGGWWGEM